MADLVRVLPDTNVCFPISLLDLLLRCDEADLHRVVWTEDLLQELEGVWVREGARSQGSARTISGLIRSGFPDGEIAREQYADLVAAMSGPDPDDHVHAAAAASVAPSVLLTANLADFPGAELAPRRVRVEHPDDYFTMLLDLHPEEIRQIIDQMSAHRRRPPMTRDEVVAGLERSGLRAFAKAIRP
jgi:hypothetical protein